MRYRRKPEELSAVKIKAVDHVDAAGGAIVILADGTRRVLTVAMTWNQKPEAGDYLVKYAEGIERLAKKQLFEERYDLIDGESEEKSGS